MLSSQEWMKNVSHVSVGTRVAWILIILMFVVLSFFSVAEQMKWNERLRTWAKVDGVIQKNEIKTVRSGKSSKKVSDIEYTFYFNGKKWSGSRKLFDSDRYPAVPRGTTRKILVNPANPRESAAMFVYTHKWYGFLLRYSSVFISTAMIVFCILGSKQLLFRKKITISAKLESYLQRADAEEFKNIGILPISTEKKYAFLSFRKSCCDFMQSRIIFADKPNYAGVALFSVQILVFSCMAIHVRTGFWILAAFSVFAVFLLLRRRSIAVDFIDRKIYFCKKFDEEQKEKYHALPFNEIRFLAIGYVLYGKYTKIGLFAASDRMQLIPLFTTKYDDLPAFFDFLPDFASRLGNLPICFFDTVSRRKKSGKDVPDKR